MLRDRCARCLPAIHRRCHVIRLRVASCHVIMSLHHHVFKTCIRPGLLVLSVIRSEPNHTCTRPRHVRNIILLVAGKCSRNGLKVGMRCCYVASRSPAKFHRIRSPFDAPTVKHIAALYPIIRRTFSVSVNRAGLHLSPLLSVQPSYTTHLVHLPIPLCSRTIQW